MYMRERGGGGRGGCGLRSVISAVKHTYIRQSRGVGKRLPGRVARTDAPVYTTCKPEGMCEWNSLL